MPRVKIDYVVSFSSESPDAPAINLLASEAGRGRWLCARGEPSCSVLLQLSKAVQITSITIGAHLAALVEVLVGRSVTPNDQYKPLVASSVFLSPLESRKAVEGDTAADRVRTFGADQLGEDTKHARWDRVRVQCSQPYNKHCKYGLSFIHIFSPEADPEAPVHRPVPTKGALKMTFDLSPQDSDDDELRPGALFAQHRARQSLGSSTDAQIRQATSDALKHQSDDSTKIVRTPISKPKGAGQCEGKARSDKDKSASDKESRAKAAEKAQEEDKRRKDKERDKDRQSSKDKETDATKRKDKSRDDTSHTPKDKHKTKNTDSSHKRDSADRKKDSSDSHKRDANDSHRSDKDRKRDRSSSSKKDKDDDRHSKKLKVSDDSDKALHPGPVSDEPHTLLSDVHFVLSGYENPRRAKVRDAAQAMGATFHRDWGPSCTHLICAFPNTPKLKTVRSLPDGHKAIIVTAEWIERCAARQRRLPWQWFATEHKYRVHRARSASGEDTPSKDSAKNSKDSAKTLEDSARNSNDGAGNSKDGAGNSKDGGNTSKNKDGSPNATVLGSDCDTDDEIERVMNKQRAKKRQQRLSSETEDSPSKKPKASSEEDTVNCSRESDVAFVRDERIQGNVTVSDSDSDVTNPQDDTIEDSQPQDISTMDGLPSFFEGCTFAVHSSDKPVLDERLVRRYVRAYGGEIVEPQEDEQIEVDYVLCLDGIADSAMETIKGQRVRGDWIWKCHERRKLCSPGEYTV